MNSTTRLDMNVDRRDLLRMTFAAGAMYAIRTAYQPYTLHEVNGSYEPGKTVLVSPRTFAYSSFGDNLLFVGGHDASGNSSDDMAWIFKASLDVVLGLGGER